MRRPMSGRRDTTLCALNPAPPGPLPGRRTAPPPCPIGAGCAAVSLPGTTHSGEWCQPPPPPPPQGCKRSGVISQALSASRSQGAPPPPMTQM